LYVVHVKDSKERGSRIIMNISPLFTGDAGESGESEIWRYILEHDLVEALIAPRRRRRIPHHRVSGKLFDPVPEHHA
jgi:hypothetical protein